MEKTKKFKIYIGLFYIVVVGVFLYYLFSKFSLQELSSYEFIKDNVEYFSKIKTNKIFLLSLFRINDCHFKNVSELSRISTIT